MGRNSQTLGECCCVWRRRTRMGSAGSKRWMGDVAFGGAGPAWGPQAPNAGWVALTMRRHGLCEAHLKLSAAEGRSDYSSDRSERAQRTNDGARKIRCG